MLTGSSHSAFLGAIPFGEDRSIECLPLADKEEINELFALPASPIQAGGAVLRDSAALSDAVALVHKLTGGSPRLPHHMEQFERELRTVLERHEGRTGTAGACSPNDPQDSREPQTGPAPLREGADRSDGACFRPRVLRHVHGLGRSDL